jgi:hypothetical protein
MCACVCVRVCVCVCCVCVCLCVCLLTWWWKPLDNVLMWPIQCKGKIAWCITAAIYINLILTTFLLGGTDRIGKRKQYLRNDFKLNPSRSDSDPGPRTGRTKSTRVQRTGRTRNFQYPDSRFACLRPMPCPSPPVVLAHFMSNFRHIQMSGSRIGLIKV